MKKLFIASILFVFPIFTFAAGLTIPQGGTGTTSIPSGYFLVGSSTLRIDNTRDFTGTSTINGNLDVLGNIKAGKIITPIIVPTATNISIGCASIDSPTFVVDCVNHLVGIGTSSPYAKLSVEQGSEANVFAVSDQGTSTPSFLVKGDRNVVAAATSTALAFSSGGMNITGLNNVLAIDNGSVGNGNSYAFRINTRSLGTLSPHGIGWTVTGSSGNVVLYSFGFYNSVSNFDTIESYDSNTDIRTQNKLNNFAKTSGALSVGSTTPWGLLSVNPTASIGAGPEFVVGSSTKTDFIVTNGGNVGIGTTSPAQTLSVQGNGLFSGNLSVASLTATGTASIGNGTTGTLTLGDSTITKTNGSGFQFGSSVVAGGSFSLSSSGTFAAYGMSRNASNQLQFNGGTAGYVFNNNANSANLLNILDSGNVGIGTANPTQKLWVATGGTDTDTQMVIEQFGGNRSALMTFNSDGSPSASNPDWSSGIIFSTNDYAISTWDGSNTTQRLVVQANTGNVGIGTTTPYATLSITTSATTGDAFVVATSTKGNLFKVSNTATTTFFGSISVPSTGNAPIVGNATLVAGTITVNTAAATANSYVLLTRKTSGGTIGTAITYTVTAGSFTITSDNILDTSTFTWFLINP